MGKDLPVKPPHQPDELQGAFHEVYRRIGISLAQQQEVAGMVYALAEVMITKGLIGLDEVDKKRRNVQERLLEGSVDGRLTVQLGDEVPDKYAMDDDTAIIDCDSRVEVCRAVCCYLRFPLSSQDIEEGVVQWELGEPYLNRQAPSGACRHLQDEASCGVYEHRPAVCRGFDCRHDRRVWVDFENKVLAPEAHQLLEGSTPVTIGRRTHASEKGQDG